MADDTPQDPAATDAVGNDDKTQADAPAQTEASAEDVAAAEASAMVEEVAHDRLDVDTVTAILEAALQAADSALTPDQCLKLFRRGELPIANNETRRELVKRLLEAMVDSYEGRGVELKRVASGYRLQVRQEYSRWVSRLWEEKPPRYSRALLETMSLIAYRQPVTRGDIEQVRGVAVSQNIMRTLTERGWIREVGHREVPGRPALYGTTKAFLDYFNLKSLAELPPLEEIRELIEPVVVEELPPPEPAALPDVDPDATASADEASSANAAASAEESGDDDSETAAAVDEAPSDVEATAEANADAAAEIDLEEPVPVVTEAEAESESESESDTDGNDQAEAGAGSEETLAEVVPLTRGKR
jgi:segregation and condensation protein B